jgi:hypothetical protein
MTTSAQIHATAKTAAGIATLRDTTLAECEPMAQYFHRPDAHLDTLIDRSRLPPASVLADGFRRMIRTGDPGQLHTTYAIYLNDRFIGFTALYRQTPDVNYSHWHIVDESARAGGISTALYPHRMKVFRAHPDRAPYPPNQDEQHRRQPDAGQIRAGREDRMDRKTGRCRQRR